MAESIISITARLTNVAETIFHINPGELSADEFQNLRDRLPQWALTVAAINATVAALEKALQAEAGDANT